MTENEMVLSLFGKKT